MAASVLAGFRGGDRSRDRGADPPETGTPGARRALVHQYIDFVLSGGEAAGRDRFREGLPWLD